MYYSVVAGERALAATGWEEAERHFRQAESSSDGQPESELTARMFRGLGVILTSYQEPTVRQRGWDLLVRAFNLYVLLENIEEAVAVGETPAAFHGLRGTVELTGKALELLEPGSLRAGYLLARHSIAFRDELGDVEEDIRCLEKAAEIARAHGDKRLEGLVMLSYGQHFGATGDRQASIDHSRRADALGREVDDRSIVVRAVMQVLRSKKSSYDLDGVPELLRRHREIAEESRAPTTLTFSDQAEFGFRRDRGEWERASAVAANELSRAGARIVNEYFTLAVESHLAEIHENDERLNAVKVEVGRFPQEALMVAITSWVAA